jgi:hypothetical protein
MYVLNFNKKIKFDKNKNNNKAKNHEKNIYKTMVEKNMENTRFTVIQNHTK